MTTTEMDNLLFNTYLGARPDATPDIRLLFMNQAQNDMAVAFFFDELETLSTSLVSVDGIPSYVYPSSEYYIQTIRDITNGHPLEEKDWDWYNAVDAGVDEDVLATGVPLVFVIHEGRIYLSPTPDDAYTYRVAGVRLPPQMVVGGQNPTITSDWHIIIVMLAAADILFALGNDVRGQSIKNEALSKISAKQEKRTFRRLQQEGQAQPRRVKQGGGGIHYRGH